MTTIAPVDGVGSTSMASQSAADATSEPPAAAAMPKWTLSQREQTVLNAYHRYHQLRLESALLWAQQSLEQAPLEHSSSQSVEEQIREAERQVLVAKAAYSIRNKAIDAVITTDPILKAAHASDDATSVDRMLAAGIDSRNELSVEHCKLSDQLSTLTQSLTTTEIQNVEVMRRNADLAQELLRLAESKKRRAQVHLEDPMMQSQVDELKDEVRSSRHKWRIIKSVVSAMVAGSGVDWANDDELRELVLDDEEDEIEELE
ncbi:MAG: hypothetical protein M1823_000847 [Watsoniomyces obsoletus]|nr:MAG: hypothetical protein M1823_000847 [Watsoniomyces obsoletus]